MHIPLSSPDISEQDRTAVMEVLASTQLSLGPALPRFEESLRRMAGTKHAIAVNSGTSALHLCIKAAGISDGDEVITTPFSFVASANCVLFERAKPVFVDIDPVTLNIDPDRIAEAITPRTRAILPVHVFGRPCAMDKITPLAQKHNLVVIEDACEAVGSRFGSLAVGSFGQTGTYAFYPNKQLTTGEGGAIVTNDDSIAMRCRSWRNQGRSESADWLEHERLGYNYRLSDINCALGCSQVSRLPEIVGSRARIASLYNEALQDIPEIVPPRLFEPGCTISWFVYVVRLREEFSRTQRDSILASLRRAGIGCRNYFTPIHLQPFYASSMGYRAGAFPITENISERTIALPFFNRLTEGEVGVVRDALREAIESLKSGKVSVRAAEAAVEM